MAFDPAKYLAEDSGPAPAKTSSKGAKFDPAKYLAGDAEPVETAPEDLPNFVSYLPPAGTETPAHFDLKNKRVGMIPDKRTNAVFSDIGTTMNADDLRAVKRDTQKEGRDAFVGGALQGATLGFGDEIAALTSPGDYTTNRDENRKAFHEVEEKAPKDYAMGKLTGSAATMLAVPSLGPNTAKPLLSLANTGRAGFAGGLQALGDTEKEDTSGQISDTLKGAGAGVAVNTVLGGIGKGMGATGRYLGALPERVAKRADDELIDAATLGAPATLRDSLQGELGEGRPEVLSYIKARPELEKALREKRPADAARILRAERPTLAADDAAAVGQIGQSREITVQPLLDRLEAKRAALASNPSLETQAEAASIQKRIDTIKEQWIPEPKPKTPEGGELLKTLVGSAQKYDVDRAAHSADDFLDVAKKYKLAKVANEPAARLESIDKTVDKLNKANDVIYDQAAKKKPIYVANLTGALLDHADTLGKEYGSGAFPGAVEAFAKGISRTATARRETSITPRELRSLISDQQGKAFSGSFANPAEAKEAWQDVTRVMRGFLEDHVEKNAGKGALKLLKQNNKEISMLLPFRSSAEEEVAASRLLPDKLPETRTGQAPVASIRDLANATKDEGLRREMTGELYQQVGPEASHRLAALDRQRELSERLEAPLVAKAAREASPPTTLRSHVGAHRAHVEGMLERGGVAGGAALTAAGQGHIGIPVMVASIAAKYGHAVARKAEDVALGMTSLYRIGAQMPELRTLGKISGLPADVSEYLIGGLLPRAAASATVKSKEKR